MDVVTGLLYGLVGLLLGGLLVLLLDGRLMGRRLMSSESDNQKLQQKLRHAETSAAALEQGSRRLKGELELASQRLEACLADSEVLQQKLEVAQGEYSRAQDNLDRMNEHAEQLRAERTTLKSQLIETQEKEDTPNPEIDQLNSELVGLKQKHEMTFRRLTSAEARLNQLQAGLAEVKQQASQIMQQRPEAGKIETEVPRVEAEEMIDSEPPWELDEDVLAAADLTPFVELDREAADLAAADSKTVVVAPAADKPAAADGAAKQANESEVQAINGIGPTYAKRLASAGIFTLAELAEQTPERLLELLGLKPTQFNKVAAWIEEARPL